MIQVLCQKIPKEIFREQCHLIPQIQWSPHGFRALKHAVNDFSAKDCQLKGYKFTLYCVSFGRIAGWPSHIWPHQSEPCWKRRISCTIDRDLKHWIEFAKKTLSKFSRYRIHLFETPELKKKINRLQIHPRQIDFLSNQADWLYGLAPNLGARFRQQQFSNLGDRLVRDPMLFVGLHPAYFIVTASSIYQSLPCTHNMMIIIYLQFAIMYIYIHMQH